MSASRVHDAVLPRRETPEFEGEPAGTTNRTCASLRPSLANPRPVLASAKTLRPVASLRTVSA